MSLQVHSLCGHDLEPHLEALGTLRIRVFREFPYLYEGSLAYEREYLSVYLHCPHSLIVLVWDADTLVGATTCLPLPAADPEFQQPFLALGIDPRTLCYFGESILLPDYRGRGIGKSFFHLREAHARTLPGVHTTTFCAVDRPPDHPARPSHHRSPETLWQRCGYRRRPELHTKLAWPEIGSTTPTEKQLTFWTKEAFPTT